MEILLKYHNNHSPKIHYSSEIGAQHTFQKIAGREDPKVGNALFLGCLSKSTKQVTIPKK